MGDGELRCLWLSSEVPYPTLSGRRVYSSGLTEALSGHGVQVHGLGADAGGRPPSETSVLWSAVGPGRTVPAWRRMVSRWPAMAVNCRTREYRRALVEALRRPDWDAVVIDHLQMAWVLPYVRAADVPIVYVSHNHESSTRRDHARHLSWRAPMKVPLAYDAWRVRITERALVAHSALVTAVTPTDADLLRVDGAERSLVLMPGHSQVDHRPTSALGTQVAVVLTNLEWHVKRTNLLRFLQAGDAVLAAGGVELRIVGPVPAAFVASQQGAWRSATFVGPVDTVGDELDRAGVGVISEPEGGGFKLKALDYVFHGVPMAVLDGSMAGLPLRPHTDHAVASTELELAGEIVRLIDHPDERAAMAASARDRCAAAFDWSTRGAALADAMRELATRGPDQLRTRPMSRIGSPLFRLVDRWVRRSGVTPVGADGT